MARHWRSDLKEIKDYILYRMDCHRLRYEKGKDGTTNWSPEFIEQWHKFYIKVKEVPSLKILKFFKDRTPQSYKELSLKDKIKLSLRNKNKKLWTYSAGMTAFEDFMHTFGKNNPWDMNYIDLMKYFGDEGPMEKLEKLGYDYAEDLNRKYTGKGLTFEMKIYAYLHGWDKEHFQKSIINEQINELDPQKTHPYYSPSTSAEFFIQNDIYSEFNKGAVTKDPIRLHHMSYLYQLYEQSPKHAAYKNYLESLRKVWDYYYKLEKIDLDDIHPMDWAIMRSIQSKLQNLDRVATETLSEFLNKMIAYKDILDDMIKNYRDDSYDKTLLTYLQERKDSRVSAEHGDLYFKQRQLLIDHYRRPSNNPLASYGIKKIINAKSNARQISSSFSKFVRIIRRDLPADLLWAIIYYDKTFKSRVIKQPYDLSAVSLFPDKKLEPDEVFHLNKIKFDFLKGLVADAEIGKMNSNERRVIRYCQLYNRLWNDLEKIDTKFSYFNNTLGEKLDIIIPNVLKSKNKFILDYTIIPIIKGALPNAVFCISKFYRMMVPAIYDTRTVGKDTVTGKGLTFKEIRESESELQFNSPKKLYKILKQDYVYAKNYIHPDDHFKIIISRNNRIINPKGAFVNLPEQFLRKDPYKAFEIYLKAKSSKYYLKRTEPVILFIEKILMFQPKTLKWFTEKINYELYNGKHPRIIKLENILFKYIIKPINREINNFYLQGP
jgi:hypothetical protein